MLYRVRCSQQHVSSGNLHGSAVRHMLSLPTIHEMHGYRQKNTGMASHDARHTRTPTVGTQRAIDMLARVSAAAFALTLR